MTALLSHQPRGNLSTLVVGLENGIIELLEVHQNVSRYKFYRRGEKGTAGVSVKWLVLLFSLHMASLRFTPHSMVSRTTASMDFGVFQADCEESSCPGVLLPQECC